jgi:AraC-like DNA-binding protein
MDQSDAKGAFSDTLARYYHQSESKTAVASWPEQSTFAITRLHSEVGPPDVSQPIPEETAIHVPEVTARGLAPWQEHRATEPLCEHLDGGILLFRVARECGMSVSHFARSFNASLGVSAHRWLVLRRIERAKELLLATQSALSDITLEAGFSDQASYNRTFRQFVGISPGRWRRELAER